MKIALVITVLGICFFITTVNCYFQKAKYKYLTKDERKKLNIFNSPNAWMSYSFVIGIMIGIMFFTSFMNIVNGVSGVAKQQTTLTEQQTQTQTDSSQQQNDSSEQPTN